MWIKSHTHVEKGLKASQIWKLFADVDHWKEWDKGVEFSKLHGPFTKGSFFDLKPAGGPKVKIELVEVEPNRMFRDLTRFPGAKMYGTHTFTETAEGLEMTTEMKVTGILGFFWRKVVAQGIVNGLPEEMKLQAELAHKLPID